MAEVIDVESIKCRFGWISIEGTPIPYVIRSINGALVKFVSVSIAEILLLRRYLCYFNPDLNKCLSVKGYYITNAEADLLNNINVEYCSRMFGNQKFIAGKDCIVRLEDVEEFYRFLLVCYNKIYSNNNDHRIEFGYIKFESNGILSVIPYFTKEGQKYLPLFYFENSTDDLLLGAIELKNWDLAYLKFCFKVLGIYDELYATDSCTLVRLTDVMNYFPPETIFEEFWPIDLFFKSHIINDYEHQNQSSFWITDYLGSSIMPQESSTANNVNQV